MRFSKQIINGLKPQTPYKRTTIKGLSIVVEQRNDLIVFSFKYKSPTTLKYRQIKLTAIEYGTITVDIINSIKTQCQAYSIKTAQGIDPLSEKKELKEAIIAETVSSKTNADLWEIYITKEKYLQLAEGTQALYKSRFKKLDTHFGKRFVNTITRLEIESFLESQLPSVKNIIIAVLIRLEDVYRMLDINTNERTHSVLRVEKLSHSALKVREQILTSDEIKELFKCEGTTALICQFQLLHGFRISEVLGLKWKDIDFTDRTVTISADRIKTQRKSSANQRDFVMPLTDFAIELLLKLGDREPDNLIFRHFKMSA